VIVFPGNDPYPEDKLLQTIAAEFNYSETAYIRKHESSSPNDFELRWFTPAREVPYLSHYKLFGLTSVDFVDTPLSLPRVS
jgi:PhzF family phenazine biosynthesis protein